MITLPTHEECAENLQLGNATALETFIHNNEPADFEQSEQFRNELSAALVDTRIDVLKRLKQANKIRCGIFGHEIKDWSPTDWACAVAGEVGEMCNFIKKKHRGDNIDIEDIAREAADVVVYLDILCQRMGIDLSDAVVSKFNEVSVRIGSDIKI